MSLSLSLSFPLPSWEFDPPQPVSSSVTAKAISLSWLRQEAWSVVVGSGGEKEEVERLRPDAISLETWGNPAWATACHAEK